MAKAVNARSITAVPMLKNNRAIGAINISGSRPGFFAARQIALLQTFADQAVIAIENVRLFDEVQARTRDLGEALQQQTATADVLKVISRSAFDLQPVLQTLVDSAVRLAGADMGAITLREGDTLRFMAGAGQDFGASCLRTKPSTSAGTRDIPGPRGPARGDDPCAGCV